VPTALLIVGTQTMENADEMEAAEREGATRVTAAELPVAAAWTAPAVSKSSPAATGTALSTLTPLTTNFIAKFERLTRAQPTSRLRSPSTIRRLTPTTSRGSFWSRRRLRHRQRAHDACVAHAFVCVWCVCVAIYSDLFGMFRNTVPSFSVRNVPLTWTA
jgi:hypothetical protein